MRTHIGLRVDVRGKPHELCDRGGVAVVSSVQERSPARLRTRSARGQPRLVDLNPVLSHAMAAKSREATLTEQQSGTIMQIMAEHRHHIARDCRQRFRDARTRRCLALMRPRPRAIRGGVTNR
jgi:hypothetical protein